MASVNLSKKAVTGIVVAVLVVLVLVVLGTTAFTTIPEGSMGVKYQLGKLSAPIWTRDCSSKSRSCRTSRSSTCASR